MKEYSKHSTLVDKSNSIMNSLSVRSIFDSLKSIIMIISEEWDVIYYNPSLLAFLNRKEADFIGKKPGEVFNCINCDDRHICGRSKYCKECGLLESIEAGLRGEDSETKCRVYMEDENGGSILDFRIQYAPLVFEEEKFIMLSIDDISSKSEMAVFEETFYHLFQNIKSGVAIYEKVDDSEDFVFRFFNKAAEQIDKTDRNDIIGQRLMNVFPGVKEFGLLDVFNDVYKTARPANFPLTFYQDNRIEGWRENYVFKLPSDEVVAVYNDVTEQKKAEHIMSESKKWLDLILKTVNTGIIIVDYDTHLIEDVNEAGLKMMDRTIEEVKGKHCREFICDIGCDVCPITDSGKEVDNSEKTLRRKDGELIPVLKTVSVGVYNDKKYLVESIVDITAQKEMERMLERMSLIDDLTQIGNRRSLLANLVKACDYCSFNNKTLAVIMIDIDFFKKYNDVYGHVKGDECLYSIATIIHNELTRPADQVYRYGGEEFIVVLSDTDKAGAHLVAERIRLRVMNEKIEHKGSAICKFVTVSMGVYTEDITDVYSTEEIIRKADDNLYLAKEAGRNCTID